MGSIVVKAKQKVRVESESGSLTIGTRSSCGLTLRDPIAAEVHCDIHFSPQGYLVTDRGSSTGTYVNGLRVAGSQVLADGDEIVLGVTKLVASIERDGDRPLLVLDLLEDKFFQKAKMSGGATPTWIPGDREAFKEAEINFGAFPALRVTGWSAVVLGLILVLVLAIPALRGRLVQPGPLHNLHAQVIAAGDCSVCHESRGDDGLAGCRDCHADELAGRHPFPSTVGFAVAEQACSRCHVEHLGTETVLRPVAGSGGAPVRVRDPRYVPADFASVVACEECHRSGVPDAEDARRRLERLGAGDGANPDALAAEREPGRLDSFSHSSHVGASGIACDKCHLAGGDGGRDYAPVAFTTCMTCHHHPDNLAYTAEEVTPDPDWVDRAPDFRIDHHGEVREGDGGGTGEKKCALCHVEGSTSERRQVAFARPIFASSRTGETLPSGDGSPRLVFTLRTRGHEDHAGAADCGECHFNESFGSTSRSDRRFFHALHLGELALGAASDLDPEAARHVSAACAECHAKTIESSSLGAPVFDEASCEGCHGSADNGDSVPVPARPDRTEEGMRYDFPHDLHVASDRGPLARGCFACHEFGGGSDDLLAVPSTPPEVANCLGCHTKEHEYTEGGSCAICHSDFSASAPEAESAGSSSFSHFEPGHAAMLSDCGVCHAGVASAERVSDIGMPSTADRACFDCHFEKRFHWR